jgi:lysophospholipase L1-like esterase
MARRAIASRAKSYARRVLVAAIGDSLTASGCDFDGWVRQACSILGHDLIEQARPGWRTEPIRRELLPVALDCHPDVCVLLAGANDVAHGRVPLIQLGRMWLQIRRSSQLIVATLPPHEGLGFRGNTAQVITNLLIRGFARATRTPIVDLTPALGSSHRWTPGLARDHGHPSDAGRAKMAEALVGILGELAPREIRTPQCAAQSATEF